MSSDRRRNATWYGAQDRSMYGEAFLSQRDALADAARAGSWDAVEQLLEDGADVNGWRLGGTSWFAPLHQAAWHGAPAAVVTTLLQHGAWRSLRDAAGDRPCDIAAARGHDQLRELLEPAEPAVVPRDIHVAWDRYLQTLIESRTEKLGLGRFRPVPTELLLVEPLDLLGVPIPGMYGGFSLSVHRGRLFVESWSRVSGGSGQAHVITAAGTVLVEEGFV